MLRSAAFYLGIEEETLDDSGKKLKNLKKGLTNVFICGMYFIG